MSTPTRPTTLSALILLAACGGDEASVPDAPAWSEADSAGITVVTNEDRVGQDVPRFVIGTEPTLSIGSMDADPEYQFFRVGGARVLSDGRLVVANSGSKELRVYDATGTFSHSHGAEGEGPGEYRRVNLIGAFAEDSLVVYDWDLRRVSLVHVDEGFRRSFPATQEEGGVPMAAGAFRDGTIVFGGGLSFNSDDGFPTGVIRNDSYYSAVDLEGTEVVSFGAWPATEMFGEVMEGGAAFRAYALPFARRSISTTGDDRFYLSTTDTYEIRRFDRSGAVDRIIRLDRPVRGVTEADREAFVEERLERAETEEQRIETRQTYGGKVPFPEVFPAHDAMIVDSRGHLWVEEYHGPLDEADTWMVYDGDGRFLGTAETPDRFAVDQIGEDFVLGRWFDDFDVEYVRIYPLTRPGES